MMKSVFNSGAARRAVFLLASALAAWSQPTNAQQGIAIGAGAGAGSGASGVFVHRIDGPGAGGGVGIVINGLDVKAMLMGACDANADGTVMPAELSATLAAWFQKADADTNATVTVAELASALKGAFPEPEFPAGFEPPPDGMRLPNVFARKLVAAADADKNGAMTLAEVNTQVSNSFAQWDADRSGALDDSELAIAFAQLTGPDGSEGPGFRPRALKVR